MSPFLQTHSKEAVRSTIKATLIGSLRQLTHLPKGSVVFDPILGKWVLSFTVIPLALQLGATGLVAWRIWATINWRERRSWTREWHALRIIVESGAIYGVLTVLSLAFYLARTNIGGINVGIVAQVSVSKNQQVMGQANKRFFRLLVLSSSFFAHMLSERRRRESNR